MWERVSGALIYSIPTLDISEMYPLINDLALVSCAVSRSKQSCYLVLAAAHRSGYVHIWKCPIGTETEESETWEAPLLRSSGDELPQELVSQTPLDT